MDHPFCPVAVGRHSRVLDRFANADIGAATADIAGHGVIDIAVARIGIGRQQGRSRHDLAGLAVAALHDFEIEPGVLDFRAGRRVPDRLDRGDLGIADAVDGGDAGADRLAVLLHRTGAALRDAAAEFRSGHAENVAQHPEQRRIAVSIDAMRRPVDIEGNCHCRLLSGGEHSSTYAPSCAVRSWTSGAN